MGVNMLRSHGVLPVTQEDAPILSAGQVSRSTVEMSSAGARFTNRAMDILTPHDGLTNEKICKAQIEAVEKKQNEYKLIGRLTKVPGHTLYKFNATTREASKAIVEIRSGYCYDPEKGPKMQIRHRFNVKIEKDCYYEQALNMKNFIKRLRRQGIIGADEDVKFVKE